MWGNWLGNSTASIFSFFWQHLLLYSFLAHLFSLMKDLNIRTPIVEEIYVSFVHVLVFLAINLFMSWLLKWVSLKCSAPLSVSPVFVQTYIVWITKYILQALHQLLNGSSLEIFTYKPCTSDASLSSATESSAILLDFLDTLVTSFGTLIWVPPRVIVT